MLTSCLMFLFLFSAQAQEGSDPCASLEGKALKLCQKMGGSASPKSVQDIRLTTTGLPSIDDVFQPVGELVSDLQAAHKALSDSQQKLGEAIGQRPCETLPEAVARFADNLSPGAVTVQVVTEPIPLLDPSKLDKILDKAQQAQDKAAQQAAAKGIPINPELLAKRKAAVEQKIEALTKMAPKIPFPVPSLQVAAPSTGSKYAKERAASLQRIAHTVSEGMNSTQMIVQTCMSVPTRLQMTMIRASTLPAKLPKELSNAGIGPEQAQLVKQGLAGNLAVLTSLPKLAIETVNELKQFISIIPALTGADVNVSPKYKTYAASGGYTYHLFPDGQIRWSRDKYTGCMQPSEDRKSPYQAAILEIQNLTPVRNQAAE